ncbi:hypothetical protein [Magnetovibrio sp.]|uniref:hypothetical protein n=1 Tax=Magnetovibrio sp. TaxID=2024836 RepID=UPI002F92FC1D
MAITFWGGIATKSKIEATSEWASVDGTIKKVQRKESGFSTASETARDDLIAAADALTPDLDDVKQVQVYSAVTDPETGGALVDISFKNGTSMRIGDDEAVPAALATARDAFIAAVTADL